MTKRSEKTRNAIKASLLTLLSDKPADQITMSELASHAEISRSTLYSHYPNVSAVFRDAVADFNKTLRPLKEQLRCGHFDDNENGSRPFCLAIRDAGEYSALVKDPSFLPTLLDIIDERFVGDLQSCPPDIKRAAKANRAIFRFQMSGCYTAAMDIPDDNDWAVVQGMLDAFIRSGVNATKSL